MAALEYAADVKALVLGKPAPKFFHAAVEALGCRPAEALMIGDDALADVEGALNAGLQAWLVRTGKYRPGDEARIKMPGAEIVEDFAAAVDKLLGC
jgi:ribonucleotide monophosphatase NagD (HAD superfamily)